jgi:hypothetical protein
VLCDLADAQLVRREMIQPGWIFCDDAGANDTYTCPTPIPVLSAYDSKIVVLFKPNTNNTGAASLNISGLGAVTIVAVDGSTLANNALIAGRRYMLIYNGTNFVLYDSGTSGGSGLSGLTDDCLLKANGTTAAECSGAFDNGSGNYSWGTVSGNRHELLWASPTGTHQHTWPAATGDVAQTTSTLTNGNLAKFDSSGRIIDAAISATIARTKLIQFIIGADNGSVLADTDDQPTVFVNRYGQGMHITEVFCESDAGTPSINLQRDDGSPGTILSSNLSCSTSGATSTSFNSGEDAIGNTHKIDFVMVSAGGTAKRVTISIKATMD